MLTLHHSRTSVAATKVRLVLSEKALPWHGELLDLARGDQFRPEYRAINPNGVVPALVHDGRVVVESSVIMHYVDEAFPHPALLPADPFGRAIARLWMKKVDEHLHLACVTLTFALAFRRRLKDKTPEELEDHFREVRDPQIREREWLAVTKGLDAPHAAAAVEAFDRTLGEMEETLRQSTFLAGGAYSLADAAMTPYVFRAQMLGLEGFWCDARPHVSRWYERVRTRASFEEAITRVMTDADRQRLHVAPEKAWPPIREILVRLRDRE